MKLECKDALTAIAKVDRPLCRAMLIGGGKAAHYELLREHRL